MIYTCIYYIQKTIPQNMHDSPRIKRFMYVHVYEVRWNKWQTAVVVTLTTANDKSHGDHGDNDDDGRRTTDDNDDDDDDHPKVYDSVGQQQLWPSPSR